MVAPGVAESTIQGGEVVAAGLGFGPTPTHPDQHGIQVHLARPGQTGRAFSAVETALLRSSPPSDSHGLPSTISCVTAPRLSRWGMGG